MIGDGDEAGRALRSWSILAMGKFGGRELNYHSDLDLIFLYEADGATVHARRAPQRETTNNQHFFSELGQRIIKVASQLGPYGRLYEIDPRLRPTGRSGALATSLRRIRRATSPKGQGQLWERQALPRPALCSAPATPPATPPNWCCTPPTTALAAADRRRNSRHAAAAGRNGRPGT